SVADCVVEHLFATDSLVDEGRRNLALAKTGDVDLRADVLIGVVDARLELVGGDRDAELDAGRAELLYRGRDHGFHLIVCCATCRGDRIRTCGLSVPNRALYQAELRPGIPVRGMATFTD